MKAKEILKWICKESIEGEYLNIIDIPDENDEWNPQTEEWWTNQFGALPPAPVPAGEYLYYYRCDGGACDWITDEHGNNCQPDVEVEVVETGDSIYLYRLED